ncbi:MAG TPA: AMP-binding protein, partial [Candidatus Nanopelagicales bacterium]
MSTMPHASYTSAVSDVALLGDTIGDNLERTVTRFGDREAVVDVPSQRRWTYLELDAQVDELARALMDLGVGKGDRVGIWAPNCPEWILVQYATAKIGAILVTVNPAYRSHELTYVINQSGMRLLVSAVKHAKSSYREIVEVVRGECPQLLDVVYIGDDSWAALLQRSVHVEPARLRERMASLSCDDAINIQYTSGTTGFPKGATLSHHNILNNGFFVGGLIGYDEHDRVCLPVPFYHCFGMVMG